MPSPGLGAQRKARGPTLFQIHHPTLFQSPSLSLIVPNQVAHITPHKYLAEDQLAFSLLATKAVLGYVPSIAIPILALVVGCDFWAKRQLLEKIVISRHFALVCPCDLVSRLPVVMRHMTHGLRHMTLTFFLETTHHSHRTIVLRIC